MLATIFVLGTKVPWSAGCMRSAQMQHKKIYFQGTSQASGRIFVVEWLRPIYKEIFLCCAWALLMKPVDLVTFVPKKKIVANIRLHGG